MLVFIDESGDPGFKLSKGSSAHFVVALVAFKDADQANLTGQAIEAMAARLHVSGEFKFSKTRPELRDSFFQAVLKFDFCVRAIVVDKSKIYSPQLRTTKESFYSFFVKKMLQFDNDLLEGAKIIIDGSGDREFRKELNASLRWHLGPAAISGVRFSNSQNDRMIQLADMCAGAIARSYRQHRENADRWRKMIRTKIEDVWDFK